MHSGLDRILLVLEQPKCARNWEHHWRISVLQGHGTTPSIPGSVARGMQISVSSRSAWSTHVEVGCRLATVQIFFLLSA